MDNPTFINHPYAGPVIAALNEIGCHAKIKAATADSITVWIGFDPPVDEVFSGDDPMDVALDIQARDKAISDQQARDFDDLSYAYERSFESPPNWWGVR